MIAKRLGRDHALAEALWRSGVHDARTLATMIADPAKVTPKQMDRWAKDFDNWGIVDAACFAPFDRVPHAFEQIEKWAGIEDEFVKRAAFALLASCVLHGFGSEADHLRGLKLIEREAADPRNFVKKGANWALRAIGSTQSPKLRAAARTLAQKLAASDDATERWNGKVALRTVAVASFAIDDTGIARPHACLAHEADAATSSDQPLDILRTHIVPDDIRQVARRAELGHENILDLGTRIAFAEQEAFALKVGPVDNVVRGKRMIFGQGDDDALTPQHH